MKGKKIKEFVWEKRWDIVNGVMVTAMFAIGYGFGREVQKQIFHYKIGVLCRTNPGFIDTLENAIDVAIAAEKH